MFISAGTSSTTTSSFPGEIDLPTETVFSLSQGHLQLLSSCPRKFQHVYLEQLGLSPQHPEQQSRQELGTRFHQLMQQRELGLPIDNFWQTDPQLNRWFTAFMCAPPPLLEGLRQSEHRRTLLFENYLLVAVYDLLVEADQRAQILDWKTYSRPQNPAWLRQNWQSRLYPFILVESSDYQPEQVSLTYWFAEAPENAEHSLTLPYGPAWHEQTRQELTLLLSQLNQWLERYRAGADFPQIDRAAGQCVGPTSQCSFAIRCDRMDASTRDVTLPPGVADVPEIPL